MAKSNSTQPTLSAVPAMSAIERQLRFSHERLQVANNRFSQLISLFEALQVRHLDTEALSQIGEMICAREMNQLDDFNKSTDALLDGLN